MNIESLLWLGGLFIAFGALAKWMPCNPAQPFWRKDAVTDVLYWLVLPFLNRIAYIIFFGAGMFVIFYGLKGDELTPYIEHGFGPLSTLPLWLQAALVFLLSDILLYWIHRGFHGRSMWKFHAIHHSSEHVDWLSTYRFHPVNTWLSFTLVDCLMLLLGFSPAAAATMTVVNIFYSAMVHANLNWTFGPLKYIFASPVFHRWHHTSQEEGMDKNFAPTFPLLDIVFGTFYMPEGKLPEHFGVAGSDIPSNFLKQLAWPFTNAAPISALPDPLTKPQK